MDINGLIRDLAFILLLGAGVTVLFKWIKQPVVLGYIVAGFLASPHFVYLPSVTTEENIEFWAQIGIIALLFSLGLEFSFKKLMNSGGSAAVTALIIITGMVCTGVCIGYVMGLSTINCLFLGGMLSMSSTTIIIKAFNDLGLKQKRFAELVLAVLIVEDLFAVLLMVLLSSIAETNSVEGGELLYSVSKLAFFLIIWFLVGVYVLPSALNRCRRFLNSETLLVVSMGLCLGMSVFSVYCGFSLALGAFVMGSILAGTSYAERIEHVVTPVKDLFGAVFFISVGMMVRPEIIAGYWAPILALSAAVIVGMIVFGTFGMLVTGQTLRVAIESGFSLTQIGEFAFIIATLGLSLGVLDPTLYPIVVAVSVLTTFLTPYFIKMAPGVADWLERHLPARLSFLLDRYQREAARDNATPRGWLTALKRHVWTTVLYSIVLIALTILSGQYLLPWLSANLPAWKQVIGIAATLAAMSPFLVALVMPISKSRDEADAASPRLIAAGVPRIVLWIFRLIIAVWFVAFVLWRYLSFGWGFCAAIGAVLVAALMMARGVRGSMRRIEDKFMDNLNERELRRSGKKNAVVGDLHLAYMTVGDGCDFAGMRLRDSRLRQRFGVSIANITRGQTFLAIPGAEERVFPGDVLGVIGTDEQIAAMLPAVEARKEESTGGEDASDFKLTSVLLTEGSALVGKTPATAELARYGVLLVAVQRGDEYLDSAPQLVFAPGDVVWVAGATSKLAGAV